MSIQALRANIDTYFEKQTSGLQKNLRVKLLIRLLNLSKWNKCSENLGFKQDHIYERKSMLIF